jgi:hypothetical protein
VLKVLMNGDRDEAVGILAEPGTADWVAPPSPRPAPAEPTAFDDHWGWRQAMAERIAAQLDPGRFGVRAAWVYGSTQDETARPESDLDILIHFEGTDAQRRELEAWLEGWGRALTESNHLRTGERVHILDARLVSAGDIAERRGLAAKIGATDGGARPLAIGPRTGAD